MASFSKKSLAKLNTVHPDLQLIMNELIKIIDVVILDGHRDQKSQDEAFNMGNSKLKFPASKHNQLPSLAVDVAPYNAAIKGVNWNDLDAFKRMCGMIEGIAALKGIKVRMGRDFSFKDYPHVELV